MTQCIKCNLLSKILNKISSLENQCLSTFLVIFFVLTLSTLIIFTMSVWGILIDYIIYDKEFFISETRLDNFLLSFLLVTLHGILSLILIYIFKNNCLLIKDNFSNRMSKVFLILVSLIILIFISYLGSLKIESEYHKDKYILFSKYSYLYFSSGMLKGLPFILVGYNNSVD